MSDLLLSTPGLDEFDFAAVSTAASNQIGFDSVAVAAIECIAAVDAIAGTVETGVPVPSYSVETVLTALVLAATVETVQMSLHLCTLKASTVAPPSGVSEDEEARKLGIPTSSIHY
mmetsp:Transcript_29810/g.53932  ORF Transcript_29810/g.53932 Transcript_29810/m.53932 type:complete len:116 (-) Transcript_29810:51-398(-)